MGISIDINMMPMPKAAVHEDARAVFPHHDVRLSRQSRMVQAIAEAVVPQPPSHNHLRLRVLAVDGCHVRMPMLWREGIAHYLCRCSENQETPDMLPKVHNFTHIPQLIAHFSSPPAKIGIIWQTFLSSD